MSQIDSEIDELDVRLLRLLTVNPRAGMREFARLLEVARGTVQSRISRMETRGIIRSYAADIDPRQLGFDVLAFLQLHVAQGKLDSVINGLAKIDELLEAHTTTGDGDILCRVVAKDNAHLEQVVQRVLAVPGVVRTRTEISLNERIGYRVLPLINRELNRKRGEG